MTFGHRRQPGPPPAELGKEQRRDAAREYEATVLQTYIDPEKRLSRTTDERIRQYAENGLLDPEKETIIKVGPEDILAAAKDSDHLERSLGVLLGNHRVPGGPLHGEIPRRLLITREDGIRACDVIGPVRVETHNEVVGARGGIVSEEGDHLVGNPDDPILVIPVRRATRRGGEVVTITPTVLIPASDLKDGSTRLDVLVNKSKLGWCQIIKK